MASTLEACRQQYEADLAWQTSCCALRNITAAHRAANRRVYEQLASYQRDLDAKGPLPYNVHDKTHTKPTTTTTTTRRDGDAALVYPDDLRVSHPRQLQRILPIPDVHKHSDCDLIYRFLIARRMNEAHAVQDVLHYIAFREKYALDTILWDHEVESLVNGLDGEELLQLLMGEMEKQHAKHGGGGSSSSGSGSHAMTTTTTAAAAAMRNGSTSSGSGAKKKHVVPLPRPLLQPGWASWNCGVDRQGNVLCYQRPVPRDLALLLRRWPCAAGQFDRRDPESYTNTPPYSNLLVRLYLRGIEKGRRLSLLVHTNNSSSSSSNSSNSDASSSSSCMSLLASAGAVDAGAVAPRGATTCIVDVGAIKLTHLTSSKYKPVVKLMRLVFSLSQVFYPENMSRLIIVNGGTVFGFVFKMVRPLLDTQTQQKIALLSETHTVSVNELKDVASPHMADREDGRSGKNNDDDDDDEDEDDEDDAAAAADAAAATAATNSTSALHKALLTYVDDRFVPSSYGGRLAWCEAPMCYGGAVPRALSSRAHFAEAAARVASKVVPELLPDEFLFQHASEGTTVAASERVAFAQLLRARLSGKSYTS